MGYMPPPPRGALTIGPHAPAPKADTAWWDTTTGKLYRFSDPAGRWLEVGVPDPPADTSVTLGGGDDAAVEGVTYLGAGAGSGSLPQSPGNIAIGAGATVGGNPT